MARIGHGRRGMLIRLLRVGGRPVADSDSCVRTTHAPWVVRVRQHGPRTHAHALCDSVGSWVPLLGVDKAFPPRPEWVAIWFDNPNDTRGELLCSFQLIAVEYLSHHGFEDFVTVRFPRLS